MNAGPATSSKSAAKPASMLGDLGPRLLSGLVMIALAIATLVAGGFVFVGFWLVAAVAIHWEWQRMTGGPHEQARMFGGGLSLALNLGNKRAVDAFYAKARRAGAKGQQAPHDAFWGGYSGYFRDPDGHLWELAWNPFWKLDAKGRVSLA